MGRDRGKGAFVRQFEGSEVLDGLLAQAGSRLDTRAVVERMEAARAAGETQEALIPTLFESEPRFPSPAVAQRLFQNLLGLWDLVGEGQPVRFDGPRPARPRRERLAAPPPFAPGEPDSAFVEAAWRYLEAEEKPRARLLHSFENRQDALLGALDASGLSDEGYALARHLLFELHAMLELGWPGGLASVDARALEARPVEKRAAASAPAPQALAAYAEEALFEAEQDEEKPLRPEEHLRVRAFVERALALLWGARKG